MSGTSWLGGIVIGRGWLIRALIEFVDESIVIPIGTTAGSGIVLFGAALSRTCVGEVFYAIAIAITRRAAVASAVVGSGPSFVRAGVRVVRDGIQVAIVGRRAGRGLGLVLRDDPDEGEHTKGG